jgi:hypothetical protein
MTAARQNNTTATNISVFVIAFNNRIAKFYISLWAS